MAIGHNTTAGSPVAQRAKAERRPARVRFAAEDIVRSFGPIRAEKGRLLAADGLVTPRTP